MFITLIQTSLFVLTLLVAIILIAATIGAIIMYKEKENKND